MAATTPSSPTESLFKTPTGFTNVRIRGVVIWHAVCGGAALLFAVMMLIPGPFRDAGGVLSDILDTLQGISASTVFRWASSTFIDGAVIVLLVVFGGLMVAQIPGLVRRTNRARMVSLALNYTGLMLSGFYMIRQMTVNADVLLNSIDEPITSGPIYDLIKALPGPLSELMIQGYWLDRAAQGLEVLPYVVLFGLAAYSLFGQRVGDLFRETLAQRESLYAYLYISPYLLLASIFTIGLFILAFYLSFNDLDLFGAAQWVGLENYRTALSDVKFLTALSNVVWYAVIVVLLQTSISLLLAVAMNAKFAGRRFFRTLFYAPSVTSPVVISLIFMWLFSGRGFVNKVVFDMLGLGPTITDLGIRIPAGSPGLQWFNTPDRLGDLTYLRPFFAGTWQIGMAVVIVLLLAIVALRAAMWHLYDGYDRRAARAAFGVTALAAGAGAALNAALGGGTDLDGIVAGAIWGAAAGALISAFVLNRPAFPTVRPQRIRGLVLGSGALHVILAVVGLASGVDVGRVSALTAALGLFPISLMLGGTLVRPLPNAPKEETTVLEWGAIETPGPRRMLGRLAVWGGVGLPALLGLLAGVIALLASQTLGYEQASGLPDDNFLPLVARGPSVAFMTIMLQNIFTTAPTFMIMYLAALQDIPPQLYEAAEIDGANRVQQFFLVTIPLLRPITLLIVVLGTIGTLQLFDQIAIITRGGPLNTTLTPVYLIYTTALGSQVRAQVGYASAMAFILGVIIFAFTFIQRRYLERGTEQY